jgi:GGDEF domain-containing protein
VLLHPLRSVEDARRVGRKIRDLMTQPFDLDEYGRFQCGLSAGMATYPLDGDTIAELLGAADQAMYRTKHATKQARLTTIAGLPQDFQDSGPDAPPSAFPTPDR